MIHLEFDFVATFCNSWPRIEIIANKKTIWQGSIEESQCINLFIPESQVNIEISGIGKCHGENQIWDTELDSQGKIVKDKTLTLSSVKINQIDMSQLWIDRLPNIHFGTWYDNKSTEFSIESPILDWIIKTKFFAVDSQDNKKMIYNDYAKKWNYSNLQQKIHDLKQRLTHA